MASERDLDKLGTVLAISNQINCDMLEVVKKQQAMMDSQHNALKKNYEKMNDLLTGQQKRQADIIKIAIGAVVAIVICSCITCVVLSSKIDSSVEVLRYENTQTAGTRLP